MVIKFIIVYFIMSGMCMAADWSSCYSDLDDLRRRSRDASEIAEKLNSLSSDYESKKSDYESCSSYKLDRFYCDSKLSDLNSAVESYNSELSNFQSEMQSVRSKIRYAEDSCGCDLSSIRLNVFQNKLDNSYCMSLLDMITILGRQKTEAMCVKQKNIDYCNKCLGLVDNK